MGDTERFTPTSDVLKLESGPRVPWYGTFIGSKVPPLLRVSSEAIIDVHR